MRLNRFEKGVWIIEYMDPDLMSLPLEFKLITCEPSKFVPIDKSSIKANIMEFIKPLPSPSDMNSNQVRNAMSAMKIEKIDEMPKESLNPVINFHESLNSMSVMEYMKLNRLGDKMTLSWDGIKFFIYKGDDNKLHVLSDFQFIGYRHPVARWTMKMIDRWINENLPTHHG